MPYFVYILQSLQDGSFYVGSCRNILLRLQRHNEGWSRSTKAKCPWKIVYAESFDNKRAALRREREIKRMKSHTYIRRLTVHAGGRPDSFKQ
jgi:putative endonuclease